MSIKEALTSLLIGTVALTALFCFGFFVPYAGFITVIFAVVAIAFAVGNIIMSTWKLMRE